ncbi:MAG TPA: membrane assembly protein AsmA [Rhodanobacteraceae bacterium]
MNARESIRSHPWRWLAAAVIVLVVIALLAAVLYVRSLLQPQRFTALLQSQLANAGLVLSLDKPAAPALWPRPAVQLQGFRLSSIGAGAPLLIATEARIVVPWRALLRRELAIQRLEIRSPRIDLDQLQALTSKLPHTSGAPQLPRIGAGIRIANGTLVREDEPLLFDIDAETGALLPDVPFHLAASAHDDADRAGRLVLDALPHHQGSSLRFDRIRLVARIEGGADLDVAGDATWNGGDDLAATLQGALELPAPSTANGSSAAYKDTAPASSRKYSIAVEIVPARGATPLVAALKLDGVNEHVDARVPPLALLDWWRDILAAAPGKPLALPPLQGHVQAGAIGYGPLHMQDVRIDAGPDVAPLPAGSAPAPASTARKGVAH